MKNRTREICTSGTVRDEGGNILIYSALTTILASSSMLKFPPSSAILGDIGGCSRSDSKRDLVQDRRRWISVPTPRRPDDPRRPHFSG